MGAAKKLIDKKVLRDLVPINALSAAHIEEITRKAVIEEVRSGRYVFRSGDRDYQTVYLLQGSIELVGKGRDVVSTVHAGSEVALHPLAHKQPRQLSARASGKVTVARIDSSLLDVLLTWDESAGYDVVEIDAQDDDDWMTRMLQSQAFLQLPPANIHQLLMRLESVNANAGETIVRQDEEGDFFYIVKKGRLAVTRKPSARGKEVLLAELGEGACFGEDALVSGTRRNASVTMVTDGSLMRLSKDDFNELLREPLVREVTFPEAQKLAGDGAQWLDVRLPGEFGNQAIKGSTNMPLSALRDQCAGLDADTTYVVCCDTGRRSSAGAFLLSQRGLTVYALKNGLAEVPDEMLIGEHPDTPSETDAEIIPFDTDSAVVAPDTTVNEPADSAKGAADSVLIDKIAAAENEKIALQQQLDQAGEQLRAAQTALDEAQRRHRDGQSAAAQEREKLQAELVVQQQQVRELSQGAGQEKERLQAELDAARQEQESGRRRLESLQNENALIQEELNRLRETLSQLQQSADGRGDALNRELAQMAQRLERQQQEHQDELREHEQELGRVREDYQQLGQRTSAVAGERDAALRELEDAQQRLSVLQEQQNARLSEAGEELEGLRQVLQDEKEQRASLQQQFSDLEARYGALEQQYQTDIAQAESGQEKSAALEAQLQAGAQKLREYEQSLQQATEREQALQQEFEAAQQQAIEREQALQQEFEAAQQQAAGREQALQQEFEAAQQQVEDDLNGQLAALQAQLDAARERERENQDGSRQLQQDLQQARADAEDALRQVAEAEKHAAEMDARLQALGSEHESEITSVREAMARAQDERDNVQREHRRLLETLRKAERDLERARHDHESEVLRLQKELKGAAGDSSAALAAEMEALQKQVSEGERLRDDLEIKLGERSAQLENEQAELEKLLQQLSQSQQSAREAEQQLIEANQSANEEMAVRLDSELQVQQALREELAAVSAERNASQEQLTVQNQELEELREAVRAVRAESDGATDKFQALQDSVQQLEQALAESRDAEQLARKEVDQLRAEAEVTRSLVDMQAVADDDSAQDEELEQARQNVEVAVRLRTQAEQQVSALQGEVERLREELSRAGSGGPPDVPAGHIPSLDENDPGASALLTPDVDAGEVGEEDEDFQHARTALLAEDDSNIAPAPAANAGSGGWKGLLTGLLAGGALASAVWWFVHSPQPGEAGLPGRPSAAQKAGEPAARAEAPPVKTAVPAVKTERPAVKPGKDDRDADAAQPKTVPPAAAGAPIPAAPKKIPPVAKGTYITPEVKIEVPVAEETAPVPLQETGAEPEETPVDEPVAGVEPSQPVVEQPARTFQDALPDGGAAPLMVALRADSFAMGSGISSPNFDERPQHRVQLSGFAISKNEVTFAQYDRFAQATGRARPADEGWGRGARPVINVSWQDAIAYTRWLSAQTGAHYRLPTESEWEFAARAGSNKRFWWGNEVDDNRANCFDCGGRWSGSRTAPVGDYPASPFALHDMAGNVMEWVQDCYVPGYADAPVDGAAVVTGDCSFRVVRGGGYSSPADMLRSASRDKRSPDARLDNLGFRVVRQGL
ncbi:MAG: SUMF1/EgtB/PvdO family nonheme iron enzyme [Thiogranum sp.]